MVSQTCELNSGTRVKPVRKIYNALRALPYLPAYPLSLSPIRKSSRYHNIAMFDPTALLPLVHLTGTVILKANNFVQKAKHVDKFLTGISNEVVCFQNVLRTLETKYVESDIGTKQIDDEPLRRLEADQWAAVNSIVRFSTATLKEVQSLVEDITQKPSVFLSNLRMRKVALQARVQERGKILEIRRQEIANYRQVLETALISIAVYISS